MKKAQIRVKVGPGIFSSERSVTFNVGGTQYSMFVDAGDVSENMMDVRVLIEYDGEVLVDLPRETVTTGRRLRLPRECLVG